MEGAGNLMDTPPPLCESIIEAIGNTPMIDLSAMVQPRRLTGRLLVKCEYFNPGFSSRFRKSHLKEVAFNPVLSWPATAT